MTNPQPFTQKLIDAGVITFNDIDALDDEDYSIASVTYYINDDYCCLYEDDEEIDILITDIYEEYDIDGNFIQYRLIYNDSVTVDDIDVHDIEGRLRVYKRITV